MDGSESRENLLAVKAAGAVKTTGVPAPCWSCRGPVDRSAVFCGTCAAVQPPGQTDYFTRLGIPPSFDIDGALLDRRYFEQQRQLHPDRFATRTGRERALSQSQATAINEAYETLKDPLRRADYLLQTRKGAATPAGCNMVNDNALLMEALELREALAEAGTADAVKLLARRSETDIESCLRNLSSAFAEDDLKMASWLTTRLKYLRKFADDCRARRLQLARA